MRKTKPITPLPFQSRAVKLAQQELRRGNKVLVVWTGGRGKTVMISLMANHALRGKRRVLVISHRREIITQTYTHLQRLGVREADIGVIRGEVRQDLVRPLAKVQVASIASLLAREHRPLADVVIVDECHHALSAGYSRVLHHYKNAQHAGFTATPHRLDGRGLGDFYDAMIVASSPSELIKKHMLLAAPLIYKAEDDFLPNLKSVRIARGDYVISDLERAVLKTALVGHVPDNWAKRARGRKTLGFAVSIEHSRSLTQRCVAQGIKASHMDGTMSHQEQERILQQFRAGRHDILFNCMVGAEGLDIPECDAVILARPTKSLALYLQQSGRAMRRHGTVRPKLLDHSMLWRRFGSPDGDRPWELLAGKAPDSVLGGETLKGCPQCHRVHDSGDAVCPDCGYEY